MKLNQDFILYDMGDEHMLVATEQAAEKFHGVARCNRTAAFIVQCLQTETSEAELVTAVEANFEGDHGEIVASIAKTLQLLRSIGALEE